MKDTWLLVRRDRRDGKACRVLEVMDDGAPIGRLNRNGRVRDRGGRTLGRFRDERSVTERSSVTAFARS